MRLRPVALAALAALATLAAAPAAVGAAPSAVSAQSACQQIQITTTRNATPLAVTPLDAIAFPVPPVIAGSTVVRQIVVCPPGAVLPPAFIPPVIGTPVFTAPVIGTPIIGTPILGTPILGTPVVAVPITVPGGQPGPSGSQPPQPPAIPGTAPHDTVRDLATRPAQFDRAVVTVTGTAAAVEQTMDAAGAPVTTFRLEAGGASIGVVAWGRAAVRAGDAVRVSGPFYVSTPFAGRTGAPWHDVIEANVLER